MALSRKTRNQASPAKCQLLNAKCWFYRLDVPRTSFFTLRFFDPRAYSRGFNGFSVLLFLRAVRFAFLRSSLLSVAVFAMSAFRNSEFGN